MAVYRFHECRFDSATGELRRGPVSVLLRPQPAAVLACLLDRAGTLVSREHLHRTLWPDGTHVQFDQGLNSCLKQLRAALGDRRIRPRFIETLTRRGYRFVPDVRRLDDMPAGVRRLVVGSIEVSDSRDSRTRSFAAGLDAELMLALSALAGGSLVIARPGVSRETRAVPAARRRDPGDCATPDLGRRARLGGEARRPSRRGGYDRADRRPLADRRRSAARPRIRAAGSGV
jgi:DNA-binding winged helix-turn-helix (wHTH) protein